MSTELQELLRSIDENSVSRELDRRLSSDPESADLLPAVLAAMDTRRDRSILGFVLLAAADPVERVELLVRSLAHAWSVLEIDQKLPDALRLEFSNGEYDEFWFALQDSIQSETASFVSSLAPWLSSSDGELRASACRLLFLWTGPGQRSPLPPDAANQVVSLLSDSNDRVAEQAAWIVALPRRQEDGWPRDVETRLLELFHRHNPRVQAAAIVALARLGSNLLDPALPNWPPFHRLASHKWVRVALLRAQLIHHKNRASELARYLVDRDPEILVRDYAKEILKISEAKQG